MRGNGLTASAYVAVADLDAHTADSLLVALGERGVAAYAEASPVGEPEVGSSTLEVFDRLYVDVQGEAEARALIDALADQELLQDGDVLAPGEPVDDPFDALDFDAAFSQIVAGFDASPNPPRPGEPVAPPAAAVRPATPIGWEDLLRPQPPAAPEPEERYVPPPPPPLPRMQVSTRIAWAAALFGPLLLFVAVLVNWQLPDYVQLLAAISFLAGFVTLVTKLRSERDEDDDDDGAVV